MYRTSGTAHDAWNQVTGESYCAISVGPSAALKGSSWAERPANGEANRLQEAVLRGLTKAHPVNTELWS